MRSSPKILLGRLLYIAILPVMCVLFRFQVRTRVLIMHDGEALLVRGWISSGRWALAGGGLHEGELPETGAQREVFEETGIKLKQAELNYLGFAESGNFLARVKYHQYFVELKEKPSIVLQRHEIVDAAWIRIDKLTKQNVEDDVLDVFRSWKRYSVSDTMT